MRKKHLLKTGFFVILAAFALFLLVNFRIVQTTEQDIYTTPAAIPPAQAALVLGSRVYANEKVSPVLAGRLDAALELHRAAKVQKFIVSGDHGREEYNEVKAMRDYLVKRGVPVQDVFMDHAGFDTYDSVYRAKHIFQADSLIIVSQLFHLPRALYIAKALDIPATGMSADGDGNYPLKSSRGSVRESLARLKAFLNVLLRSKPTYLGDPIPLTGDGRQTDDESGT